MKPTMIRSVLAAAVLMSAAGPALAARDTLGTLTFEGPGAGEQHEIVLQSMHMIVPPPGAGAGEQRDQSRTITISSSIEAPDPALLSWLVGPETKRHAVIRVFDRANPKEQSTFDLTGAQAAALTFGYSGAGSGSMTLSVMVEHLLLNGQTVY